MFNGCDAYYNKKWKQHIFSMPFAWAVYLGIFQLSVCTAAHTCSHTLSLTEFKVEQIFQVFDEETCGHMYSIQPETNQQWTKTVAYLKVFLKYAHRMGDTGTYTLGRGEREETKKK